MEIGDIVKYKNYEARIVFPLNDGYIVRFRKGDYLIDRFCHNDELKPILQISIFDK